MVIKPWLYEMRQWKTKGWIKSRSLPFFNSSPLFFLFILDNELWESREREDTLFFMKQRLIGLSHSFSLKNHLQLSEDSLSTLFLSLSLYSNTTTHWCISCMQLKKIERKKWERDGDYFLLFSIYLSLYLTFPLSSLSINWLTLLTTTFTFFSLTHYYIPGKRQSSVDRCYVLEASQNQSSFWKKA